MPKRFTATEIWDEDWFLEMPNEYRLLWYYMLSKCDHAGLFRVNIRQFSLLSEHKISAEKAINFFNYGKVRIRVINDRVWLIEDFFVFQYGEKLNLANKVHKSIQKIYNQLNIDLGSIRGLREVTHSLKDKDKDIGNIVEDDIGGMGEKEEEGNEVFSNLMWWLKYFHGGYKLYQQKFGQQQPVDESDFELWRKLIRFIYDNGYADLFNCRFVTPKEFVKIHTADGFTEDKWDQVLKRILATGIKPEHNLFFRIPQFIEINNEKKNGKSKQTVAERQQSGFDYAMERGQRKFNEQREKNSGT